MRKKPLLFWGTILLFLLVILLFLPPLSRYLDLKQEDERLGKELAMLTEKIEKLEEERDLLKNDVLYLEKVIRQEMGYVKPGEVIYKVIDTPAADISEPQE